MASASRPLQPRVELIEPMKICVRYHRATCLRRILLGVALACATPLLSGRASAERCAIWPAVFPANGDTVAPNTHLWIVCALSEEPCEPLTLRDANGALVPLVQVEQRRSAEGPSRRLLRYAPRAKLAPGSYELTNRASRSLTFRVAPGGDATPQVPKLLEYRFNLQGPSEDRVDPSSAEERIAQFVLAAPDGLLLADVGEANDDPLGVVSDGFTHVAPGRYIYWLGWGACRSTLPEADYCTRTRVRFGTLSGAGTFSGWTAWQAVEFPGSDCAVRARGEQLRRLQRWGVTALVVAAASGGVLWFARRRRSLGGARAVGSRRAP
jgi:hypothetical protein